MQNTIHEPTTVRSIEAATHNEATESPEDEMRLSGEPSLIPLRASRPRLTAAVSFSLLGRGLCLAHHPDHSHQCGNVPCCKPTNLLLCL